MHLNLSPVMIPGLIVLCGGAFLTFFAGKIANEPEKVSRLKIIGVVLCALGAVLTLCL